MYLHLGQDTLVKTQDLVGIFDLDNTTVNKNTRGFLTKAQKEGRVVDVTTQLPKTFIVCGDKKDNCKVYLSLLSAATLRKRTGYMDQLANV